ncbi:MAG: YceI family protein [Flavobacteriaceae bacterium]|nr:YceI family protein [Flavobacteriaceae bacterium]
MRKIIIAIICIAYFTTICNAQEKLNINITKSSIKWIGEYTFYFGGHDGFIQFTGGHFIKTGEVITGGEFTIDMNSITNTDIKTKKGKESLVMHLKESDFFDTKKHPFAKLIITSVEYTDKTHASMKAVFILKGIKKTIRFRSVFNYDKKQMTTRFKIDRRDWNVNYKSKFKDGAISDAIGFEVLLKL